jgi:large subunit ribosomal protein L6
MSSRVARKPITIPKGVDVNVSTEAVAIKGTKGSLTRNIPVNVLVAVEDNEIRVSAANDSQLHDAVAGTTRALLNNMILGVSQGFERKLVLVGVGYRAQAQGQTLNLTLGFSHPVVFNVPQGITVTTPSQTEIVVQGIDRQLVGQVAAKIREYRQPEPYKGKGVRYSDEKVEIKETKKK